ncbi:DUF2157 domain-containing protein [Mesorhizobium sp. CAU 1741]|uniref:DUF2157 domain-containing protein n=1 Tax=Mesorhizobium sp. CAU 1741 TaxID=3140366 RepID=UPI00325A6C4F
MASYPTRVKRDIERWRTAGLVDAATARVLAADIDANGGGRLSFGVVLSLMAAALFAAAVLIFIAANWQAMPRLARVAMLFALIIVGYVGGAMLKRAGRGGGAEAAWIVAAAAFGASLALIGQMYHLSGDEKQAVFVWGLATALAAGALRSGPLTVGAVLLGIAWMVMHPLDRWEADDLPTLYIPFAAVLYVLSFWTRSPAARHLLIQSFLLFAFIFFWRDESVFVPQLVAVCSAALFAFGVLFPRQAEALLGLGGGLPIHGLVGFLVGIGILQFEWLDEPLFLVTTLIAFAGIIGAMLTAGRENAWLRRLAYAAFICQLCFVYTMMLGSMLGTAGFFVFGGLALSVLAWIITRLERRFSSPSHSTGAA